MDDNCIFCKLANGVFQTNTIFEDDDFRVIMDANPMTKGHALILPKEHAANIMELPDEIGEKVVPLAKRIANRMVDVLKCDGVNIMQNNGEAAGQTVFHFHMHVIPRMAGDGALSERHVETLSEEQIKAVCDELKM